MDTRHPSHHVRSRTALLAIVALALGSAGCIEKRPRRAERAATASAPKVTAVVDPAAVDGALDSLIEGDRYRVLVSADDPAQGAAEPLVTIVEYSDFECPFCSKLAANLAAMVQRYPDDVRLVFRQFPLPMHKDAEPAARAAMAAHNQGAFWEMHDRLFSNRTKLRDEDLTAHAKDIGIDVARWTADFAAPATVARVRAEADSGRTAGVDSTPTFFVNGRKLGGAKDIEALVQVIEEERTAANKLISAGAKRGEIYARFMHAAKLGTVPVKPSDPTHKPGDASKSTNYAVGIDPSRPVKGPADALVTVVAFMDYGCPDCKNAHGTFARVMAAHPEVRFSLRFLPQTRGAEPAARVALAASLQGKLWETHTSLVALDTVIDGAPLRKVAAAHDLDLTKLDADFESPRVLAMLAEDKGISEQVSGSAKPPFYFVNGRILEQTATAEQFDALIVEEAKKAELFIASESLSRNEAFEAMRRTWRGFKLIDAVPKAATDAAPPKGAAEPPAVVANDLADTPVRGDAKLAKVTIVACTDFDCPACARGAKTLGQLRETYGDALAVQFRHLVPPGRTAGEVAHLAAIAAGQQGKFWEMHDALYKSRSARSDAALEKLATAIGLDVAKWNADRKDERLRARLEEDTAACGSLGLTGLPSWKVGDDVIQGTQPKGRFVKAIDAVLAKAP